MATGKLLTDNPELLHYLSSKLHITILGGIKFTGLDRLKVTLKIVRTDNKSNPFRHNIDLYNSIQTSQLIERSADFLDIATTEVSEVISTLTTALESYRAAHLESLKPKPQEIKQLNEAERTAALTFLKAPDLLKQTAQTIAQSGIIGEETNALIAYLIYTSRSVTHPYTLCAWAQAERVRPGYKRK